jgi:hypothetical protein
MPEQSAQRGLDAKRISSIGLIAGAEKHLRELYGEPEPIPDAPKAKARWIEAIAAPHIYLNHRLIAAKKRTVKEVTDAFAAYLRKQDGIQSVFTAEQLTPAPAPGDDPFLAMAKKSFYPSRSGDVYVILKPYYLIGTTSTVEKLATGTTHGSPHPYDTHVPLIAFGPGVHGGSRSEQVTPLHLATIASWFLNVPKPKNAEYDLPKTLLAK